MAAQLVIVRTNPPSKEHNPNEKPTMWVAWSRRSGLSGQAS
jgi:hypothetical protein